MLFIQSTADRQFMIDTAQFTDLSSNKYLVLLLSDFMKNVVDFVECRSHFIRRSLNANTVYSLSLLDTDSHREFLLQCFDVMYLWTPHNTCKNQTGVWLMATEMTTNVIISERTLRYSQQTKKKRALNVTEFTCCSVNLAMCCWSCGWSSTLSIKYSLIIFSISLTTASVACRVLA